MRKYWGLTFFDFILLLVVAGVLAYVFLPKFFMPSKEKSSAKLKVDFAQLNDALENYRLDNGAYPTTEQGLSALVTAPTSSPAPQYWKTDGYITKVPLDPWGRDYQYVNNYDVIRVFSYGPAGSSGNTEIDISSLEKP